MNFASVQELKTFLMGGCKPYQTNDGSVYESAVEKIWKSVPDPYTMDPNEYLTHVRWDKNKPDIIFLVTDKQVIPVFDSDGVYFKEHSDKELVIIPALDGVPDPYVFQLQG